MSDQSKNNFVEEIKPEKEIFFSDFIDYKTIQKDIRNSLTPEQQIDVEMFVSRILETNVVFLALENLPSDKRMDFMEAYADLEKSDEELLNYLDEHCKENFREKIREKAPEWEKGIFEDLNIKKESEGQPPSEQKG